MELDKTILENLNEVNKLRKEDGELFLKLHPQFKQYERDMSDDQYSKVTMLIALEMKKEQLEESILNKKKRLEDKQKITRCANNELHD